MTTPTPPDLNSSQPIPPNSRTLPYTHPPPNPHLRLLLVEDEAAHVEAIRRAVEAAFGGAEIRVAETLKQYREACAERLPDIALMDLNLPDGRALDVLTAPPESNPFPIVIMTSYGNESLAVEAMKAGALDYIVKSAESFQAMAHTLERSLKQWVLLQERKQAEETRRESEENFRALAESAFDGILIAAADGRLLYANPRALELSGYSQQELLQTRLREWLVPSEDPAQARSAGKPAPPQYETVIRRQDGAALPIEVSAARTSWRKAPCELILFRDISHRKRLEEEILKISAWEKQRIGRDLHDGVAQQLAAAAYLCHSLKEKTTVPSRKKDAAELDGVLQQSLAQIRQFARGLLPVGLEDAGLAAAVRHLTETMAELFQVNCRLEPSGDEAALDLQTSMNVYYLVQEAVRNAVRHGRARNIVVSLAYGRDRSVAVTVRDDGSGFDPSEVGDGGMGLQIMRYRADVIGGALTIESRKGGGTRIRCELPGRRPPAGRDRADKEGAAENQRPTSNSQRPTPKEDLRHA